MKDRIKQIIKHENITYGEFAELIGIQPSGVSHLISGRNNPSLEVIQKILNAFDYINTDWLLLGKGNMIKENPPENTEAYLKREMQGNLFQQNLANEIKKEEKKENTIRNKKTSEKQEENTEKNIPPTNKYSDIYTEKEKISHSPEDNFSKKKIIKIVIFYSDKTFSEFTPE